jgi:hypothetical protein
MDLRHLVSVDTLYKYPLTIVIALIVIAISMITSIIVYLVIFFSRVRVAYINMRTDEARELISDKLNSYLYFMEGVGQVTRGDVRHLTQELLKLKSKVVKQVLLDQIIYLSRNLTHSTSNILHTLYRRLGLKTISVNKLTASAWEVKAQGISELKEMSPVVKLPDILRLTHSRNDDLRVEAQAAYIRLNTSNPFSFLDNTPEVLLEWHQIILFDEVTRSETISIPSFSAWLNSGNTSIVLFCIKLIVHYTQLDAIPHLIALMEHKEEEEVQNRSINALGKLEAREAEEPMVALYPTLCTSCKIEVLKALGRIGGGDYIPFLSAQFTESDSYYTQKYAMCSLKVLTEHTKEEVLAEFSGISAQREGIIHHCFDNLIR